MASLFQLLDHPELKLIMFMFRVLHEIFFKSFLHFLMVSAHNLFLDAAFFCVEAIRKWTGVTPNNLKMKKEILLYVKYFCLETHFLHFWTLSAFLFHSCFCFIFFKLFLNGPLNYSSCSNLSKFIAALQPAFLSWRQYVHLLFWLETWSSVGLTFLRCILFWMSICGCSSVPHLSLNNQIRLVSSKGGLLRFSKDRYGSFPSDLASFSMSWSVWTPLSAVPLDCTWWGLDV